MEQLARCVLANLISSLMGYLYVNYTFYNKTTITNSTYMTINGMDG